MRRRALLYLWLPAVVVLSLAGALIGAVAWYPGAVIAHAPLFALCRASCHDLRLISCDLTDRLERDPPLGTRYGLIRWFRSERDLQTRYAVCLLLGHYGGEPAVPVLDAAARGDPDFGIRAFALENLNQLDGTAALAAAEMAARDAESLVRRSAALVAGSSQEVDLARAARCVALLQALAHDSDRDTARVAIRGLARDPVTQPAQDELVAIACAEDAWRGCTALCALPSLLKEQPLRERLAHSADTDPAAWLTYAVRLIECGDASAMPRLLNGYAALSRRDRASLVEQAVLFRTPQDLPLLVHALRDPDLANRFADVDVRQTMSLIARGSVLSEPLFDELAIATHDRRTVVADEARAALSRAGLTVTQREALAAPAASGASDNPVR